MAALSVSLLACGSPPNAAGCTQASDCTGDAVCAQNLCQQGYRLSATTTGDGAGRVTSTPDGFSCPGTVCSAPLAAGTAVTLHAIPDADSDFLGWSGACSGTGDCAVTMDAAKSATAQFRSNAVVFTSELALDGTTDAPNTNSTLNVWRVNAGGNGLKPLTKGTASGANSLMPRLSPDGKQVVFASALKLDGTDAPNTAASTTNIWKVNADGTGLTPLTRGTATTDTIFTMTPEWSGDGARVVFISSRNVDGSDTPNTGTDITNVWRVNADGTGLAPVTTLTAASTSTEEPQFSPDGTRILFASNRKLDGSNAVAPTAVSNVWRVNADGSGLTPLTLASVASADSSFPRWSPDGSKIVFSSSRNVDLTNTANPNGVSNIWRINADGTGLAPLTRMTAPSASSISPRWSPDGSRIVFTSAVSLDGSNAVNTGNVNNVWMVNADGSGLAPLTRDTASGDTSLLLFPQWSLEGSRIFFSSSLKLDGTNATGPNGTLNLWRLNVNGGTLTPLTKGTASGASSASFATGDAGALWFLQIVLAAAWMNRRRRRRR
jgi:Tol biopolymer transport system component